MTGLQGSKNEKAAFTVFPCGWGGVRATHGSAGLLTEKSIGVYLKYRGLPLGRGKRTKTFQT